MRCVYDEVEKSQFPSFCDKNILEKTQKAPIDWKSHVVSVVLRLF